MTPEEIKAQMGSASDNINNIRKSLEDGMNVMLPFLQKMGDEQSKMSQPKDRKTVKFEGKDVLVSLTIDGRIFLQFDTLSDAQKCYDEIDIAKSSLLEKIFGK
jgi:hypothetical protein